MAQATLAMALTFFSVVAAIQPVSSVTASSSEFGALATQVPTWAILPVPDTEFAYFRDVERGPQQSVVLTEDGVQGLYGVAARFAGEAFFVSLPGFHPSYVSTGSDGNLYVELATDGGGRYVGVYTTGGQQLALYNFDPSPSGDVFSDANLVLGPDGNMWLCELKHVASISPKGVISEYSIEQITSEYNESPTMAVGPDGSVWFTVGGALGVNPYLAKIDPSTHRIVAYRLPYPACLQTRGLAVGGDRALYVACETPGGTPLIARVTRRGAVSTIPYPPGFMWYVNTMAGGADGKVYFSSAASGGLGSYDPRTKSIELHNPPAGAVRPILRGPDGNIWGGVNTIGVDIFHV